MLANKTVARFGVAAIALGLITGPQAAGLASADTSDAGSATSSSGQSARGSAAARSSRAAKSNAAPAAASAAANSRRAAAADSAPARVPNSVAAVGGGAPSAALVADPAVPAPTDKVTTDYGNLGKWMINKDGAIATWLGKPQPVNTTTGTGTCPPCTPKTILEGINVVFVDTASSSPSQAARNLNAWLRQSGFGASAISSTGYQGYLGSPPALYSQQPTGPNQAFRNSFFLFANSHARVFGPYPNQDGPGYVWTSSFSEENWTITNPLTHGYQSFLQAQTQVTQGMLSIGAELLSDALPMYNKIDTPESNFSSGDATGYATVLGLNKVLKAATTPRGAVKGGRK